MQNKRISLIEAVVNTIMGLMVSLMLTLYAMPYWGYAPPLQDALEITFMFTISSVARGYICRRIFNKGLNNGR